MATIIDIAEAVKNELNGGTFSQIFTAENGKVSCLSGPRCWSKSGRSTMSCAESDGREMNLLPGSNVGTNPLDTRNYIAFDSNWTKHTPESSRPRKN